MNTQFSNDSHRFRSQGTPCRNLTDTLPPIAPDFRHPALGRSSGSSPRRAEPAQTSQRPPSVPRSRRRRRRKNRLRFLKFFLIIFLLFFVVMGAAAFALGRISFPSLSEASLPLSGSAPAKLRQYASEYGLALSDYPDELIELYKRNPETEQFVFEYPLKKADAPAIDLSGLDTSSVPLLMQWDQRWGYTQYSGDLFGLTGCGPTCLSMVALYLTGDTSMNPAWMADFASSNGYASEGNGSAWTLFSEGGVKLGFDVTEIPLDEQRILRNLEVGNPIIASMGKGDFTTTGHFIVITGCEDGKLRVNDPNSHENSEQLWEYDRIQGQIKNLWVFRN